MNGFLQSGLTLIEVLLACALSSFLFATLLSSYVELQHCREIVEQLSNFQKNSYFLNHLLRNRLQQAGNAYCLTKKMPFPMMDAVRAYQAENIPNEWGIHALPRSEVLVLQECIPYQDKMQFVKIAYFIGNSHGKNNRGQEIDALYEKIFGGHAEELIPNFETMKIRLGVEKPGAENVLEYESADDVSNWGEVRSVEIFFQDQILHKKLILYTRLREQLL